MKFFLLFSGILSFASVSADGKEAAPPQSPHTEAGFSWTCAGCEANADEAAGGFHSVSECLALLEEECQEIPPKHRMTCEENSSFRDYAKKAGSSVLLCGEYLIESADFMLELVWSGLKFSAASIFDSQTREENAESLVSMKNYLAIEFLKTYREAEGTKAEKFLKTVADLGGDSLESLFSWIKNFVHEQFSSFKCYNGTAQTAVLCSVAAGLMIPLPGSSFFSSASLALKTGQLSAKTKNFLRKTAEDSLSALNKGGGKKIRLSGEKLKLAANRVYRDMSSKILAASKDMPKNVQEEVSRLFAQKEVFRSKLESAVKKTGGNLNSITLTAAAAGALLSYRLTLLSKETVQFVTTEAADMMSTAYVEELLADRARADSSGNR